MDPIDLEIKIHYIKTKPSILIRYARLISTLISWAILFFLLFYKDNIASKVITYFFAGVGVTHLVICILEVIGEFHQIRILNPPKNKD